MRRIHHCFWIQILIDPMTFSWKANKSESAQNKWVRKSMWEGIWAVAPVLSVAVSHHHQHPTHSQTNRSRPPLPTKLTHPKSLNLPQCTNVTSRDAHCYLWPLKWVWRTLYMFCLCSGICTCWCRNVILKNAWSFPRLQVRYLVDPNPVPPSLWSDTVTDEGRSWIGIFKCSELSR